MPKIVNKIEKQICLDEIDQCIDLLESGRYSMLVQKDIEKWLSKQKKLLRNFGYKLPIRRQKKRK